MHPRYTYSASAPKQVQAHMLHSVAAASYADQPRRSPERGRYLLQSAQELAVAQALQHRTSAIELRGVTRPLRQHDAHTRGEGDQLACLRHLVASRSGCPWRSAHQAQCSSTVACGAAGSRSRRIASCSGPIRRGQPGMGLRSNEPVSRSCTTARFTVFTAT